MKLDQQFIDSILVAMENPGSRKKARTNFHVQINRVSKKGYRGRNAFYLSYLQTEKGYTTGQRLTFNQVKELKGTVKKGEKGTSVIFRQWLQKDPLDDDRIPVSRYYTVFNIDQCQDVDALAFNAVNPTPKEELDLFTKNYIVTNNISFTEELNGNWYHPVKDVINIIPLKNRESSNEYYKTFFHEIIHSTGIKTRCARKEITEATIKFGSYDYSLEELVAEFGACILGSHHNIDLNIQNSANYLASRSKKIKKENREKEIQQAIGRAQRAVDFILGTTFTDADLH